MMKFLKDNSLKTLNDDALEKQVKYFELKLSNLWKLNSRSRNKFEKSNSEFLKSCFILNRCVDDSEPQIEGNHQNEELSVKASASKCGRPRLREISERTKRRRVIELCNNYDYDSLAQATTKKYKPECTTNSAQARMQNGASAMYMDLGFTKSKYEDQRSYNKMLLGDRYYPPYEKSKLAKNDCYPESITVSESGAEVNLQKMMNHTVQRIITTLTCENLSNANGKEFTLFCKWGMDGSSGQQTFKQKWNEETYSTHEPSTSAQAELLNVRKFADDSVFIISFVPLQISFDENNDILWKNDRPSSIRLCRPIKFEFAKETAEKTLHEYKYYSEEIKRLEPISLVKGDITFNIKFKLQCTMIDGKVCNVLSGQRSTGSCNICGAKPTQMNDTEKLKSLEVRTANYQFGLSTLHCWIRFMECILHIAYNLEFEKGFASGENKVITQKRKQKIQNELKKTLSISVDCVKPGYETTNDGNTARRFFSEPEKVSQILGVNQNLIERFANILQVIASGLEIDVDKFQTYTRDTADIYVQCYKWYNMPPSVHKVLIHGSEIIKELTVPIGRLSEEAQEASNKFFKNARLHNSRCFSRKANNEDILHHLLISSDPLISHLRLKKEKKYKELSVEAKELLQLQLYEQ